MREGEGEGEKGREEREIEREAKRRVCMGGLKKNTQICHFYD